MSSSDAIILNMNTSPTLTTNYLAEPDPRQHALTNLLPTLFPHSPNPSEEEMEEKEHVNQNLHIIPSRTMFVSRKLARNGTYVAAFSSVPLPF